MTAAKNQNTLSAGQREDLLKTLKARFEKHTDRHAGWNGPR